MDSLKVLTNACSGAFDFDTGEQYTDLNCAHCSYGKSMIYPQRLVREPRFSTHADLERFPKVINTFMNTSRHNIRLCYPPLNNVGTHFFPLSNTNSSILREMYRPAGSAHLHCNGAVGYTLPLPIFNRQQCPRKMNSLACAAHLKQNGTSGNYF